MEPARTCIACQQSVPADRLTAIDSELIDVCKACWVQMPVAERVAAGLRIQSARNLERLGSLADVMADFLERPGLGDIFQRGEN